MRPSFKSILCLALLTALFPASSRAAQQAYLSESPNGRYRVLVEQVLDRRVEDNIFFRYPIIVENIKNVDRRFETVDAGPRLARQTEKKTFEVRWDNSTPPQLESVRFDWAPDSLKFFMHLEVLEGIWKTYFVDINKGTTTDVTGDLEQALSDKIDFRGWDCQQPKFKLVHWVQPHLAFFRLTTVCGKSKTKENSELFYVKDTVLFDTELVKTVDDCGDCKNEKAIDRFNDYYRKSLPTPTPTAEETPTNQ